MTAMRVFDVSVGDVLYRAEARCVYAEDVDFRLNLRVVVVVTPYRVARVTAASYWLFGRGARHSRHAVRPWARRTEAEALEHLRMRSLSRCAHARRRLAEAQAVLRKLGIDEEGGAP